jgi:hypothetical protein
VLQCVPYTANLYKNSNKIVFSVLGGIYTAHAY